MTTRSLLLAAAAAVAFTAAPAFAQMRTDTDAGKPRDIPHQSSRSGLPTESPQVESLDRQSRGTAGATQSGRMSGSQSGSYDNRAGSSYDNRSGADHSGMTSGRQSRAGGMAGSTGGSDAMTGSASGRDHNITARRGRGQNDKELTQTSLLNEFSAMGFTAVRDFQKRGDNYVATVQDQTGRWTTVEMDPRTRQITEAR